VGTLKSGVYFVGIHEGEYLVKEAGSTLVFKGNKKAYDRFIKKQDERSVFIIDDIPREVHGTNIFDWID
jgi:hypothetical protein